MKKFIIVAIIDVMLITPMVTPILMELYVQIIVNRNITSTVKLLIILFSMFIAEWRLSFLHEKMHMRMAKHYHPECEYKITNNHFSCSNPKAFSPKEIKIVAASASIVNLLIAALFAIVGVALLKIGVIISIIILSLYNLIIFSDNETTTDGYLIIFPEKFYEVGRF